MSEVMSTERWTTLVFNDEAFANYQISDRGQVRYVGSRRPGRFGALRKLSLGSTGYLFTGITSKKHRKILNITIHRAVAWSFLGAPKQDKMVVNHINGVKTDNRLENLEWITYLDNRVHTFQTGLSKARIFLSDPKLMMKQARQIRKEYATGDFTYEKLAKRYKVGISTIGKVINNELCREDGLRGYGAFWARHTDRQCPKVPKCDTDGCGSPARVWRTKGDTDQIRYCVWHWQAHGMAQRRQLSRQRKAELSNNPS